VLPTVFTALVVLVVGLAVQRVEARGGRVPILSAADDALERSTRLVATVMLPLCAAGLVFLVMDPTGGTVAIPAGVAVAIYAALAASWWRRRQAAADDRAA
jgi:hypothetical protein